MPARTPSLMTSTTLDRTNSACGNSYLAGSHEFHAAFIPSKTLDCAQNQSCIPLAKQSRVPIPQWQSPSVQGRDSASGATHPEAIDPPQERVPTPREIATFSKTLR